MSTPTIKIAVSQADATLVQTVTLTAGMVSVPTVKFSFSSEWNGLGKIAVFRAGSVVKDVQILNNEAVTPIECLETAGVNLIVGVYGANETVVIPTVWCACGEILDGTDYDEADNVGEPTTELLEQIEGAVAEIEEIAETLETYAFKEVEVDNTDADQYGTAQVVLHDSLDDDNPPEDRTLTFDFKNLKGNGITSITYSSSGEYEGRINIKTDADTSGTNYDALIEPIAYFKSVTNAAEDSAETAEAYAKGTVNGTPVTSGQTGYEDNAKYYAGIAEDAKSDAETAQSYAEDAQEAAETAQTAAETAQGLAEAAATSASGDAGLAAGSASSAADSATAAAGSANEAAGSAEDAAAAAARVEGFAGLTASATSLEPEESATATVTGGTPGVPYNIAFGIPQGEKGDTGYPTDAQVETAVEAWLEDNVDPETGYVLDRTLTANDAAAPADLVGDLKSAFEQEVSSNFSAKEEFIPTTANSFTITANGIDASGKNSTNSKRSRTGYFNITVGKHYHIILKSSSYQIINVWEYSQASETTGVRKDTQYGTNDVLFTPASTAICMRMTFAKADKTQEMNDADRTAIMSALEIYSTTDDKLQSPYVSADAKAVGDVIKYATGCKPIKYQYGYFNLRDYDTVDITTPLESNGWKCAVVPCSAGDKFTINAKGLASAQVYAFLDSSKNIIKRYGAHTVEIYGLELTAPAGSAYLVLNDNFDLQSYYGVIRDNVSEWDALTENIEPISWANISHTEGSGHVLGWRTGEWKSDGTTDNTAIGCIRYWTSLSKKRAFNSADYVEIIPPSGMTMYLREMNGDTQVQNYVINGRRIINVKDEYIYKPTLYGMWDADPSTYLTANFLNQIYIRPIVSVRNKEWRQGTYEFFTIDVERPLPFNDESYSTSTETIECVLRLPTTYNRDGKPTRLILMAHGAHGYIDSANETWYSTSWKALCDDLLEAGYAVFDSNVLPLSAGISPDNVAGYANGSPLYVNVLKKAYDYIQDNYNVYPQIFCHGTSMGGAGATAFSHAYPGLVLAESSYAGRDVLRYIYSIWDSGVDDRFAKAYGYNSMTDLNSDKFSHIDGISPSLSLKKLNSDGTITVEPDRETDYSNWLEFWGTLANKGRNDDAGTWIGYRTVPYKAWNSWADNQYYTKLEETLQKAYTLGSACPYYLVNYETGSHDDMCFGRVNNMTDQLIAWYKRWE